MARAPSRRGKRKVGARARQVLDVVYRLGEASAGDILAELPDLPSYSAVRSILRALEGKGLVRHREKGLRYVYAPTVPKRDASKSALGNVLETFFDGSPERAMQALIDLSRDGGKPLDAEAIERLIERARSEGR